MHPGGVATNIAADARVSAAIDPEQAQRAKKEFAKALVTTPATAATRIVTGILRREKRILVGRDAQILDAMQRLSPTGYYALLRKRLSRRPNPTPHN